MFQLRLYLSRLVAKVKPWQRFSRSEAHGHAPGGAKSPSYSTRQSEMGLIGKILLSRSQFEIFNHIPRRSPLLRLTHFCLIALAATTQPLTAQDAEMSFFITSQGLGNGADLGGLDGADAHCQSLAEAAGATGKTWRAYLSTQVPGGRGISARDRIGAGPWYNAKGELIAQNIDLLHVQPNIFTSTALTENGDIVNPRGAPPVYHDILTGSQEDGTSFPPRVTEDRTCSNWTSSADGVGSAMVGHHDRNGGGTVSWNTAHPSRGCSQENLQSTGGNGYFYCFAAD